MLGQAGNQRMICSSAQSAEPKSQGDDIEGPSFDGSDMNWRLCGQARKPSFNNRALFEATL
jgi:hypothetical protein